MKNKIFLSLLLIAFFFTGGMAQHAALKNAITYKVVGTNFSFPFDNDFGNADAFAMGGEIGYVRYLNDFLHLAVPVKLGYAHLPFSAHRADSSRVIGSLDALLHLTYSGQKQLLNPYLLAGIGGMVEPEKGLNVEFPVGIGMKVRMGEGLYFDVQGEYRFDLTENRNNLQLSSGFSFLFGGKEKVEKPKDSDGDGVEDLLDKCPTLAGKPELQGCPDSDGDGVPDKEDDCPGKIGNKAHNGCPDTDGDGIYDQNDKCPNVAGTKENGGCPAVDSDGDGVADSMDACPTLAGKAEWNGCPDSDGDGLYDSIDKCPDEAGTTDNYGCPKIEEKDQDVLDFAMHAVEFETAKATLKPSSYTILNKIVEIMNKYPQYHLNINGHTDSIGSYFSNQVLSEKRAKACYDYLVSKGISKSRMKYVGYGEKKPIATNMYKDGRKKNRRVEFELYLK